MNESRPMRTLGRARPIGERAAQAQSLARLMSRATGRGLPKGVFKFKTHEEAEVWKKTQLKG